MSIEFQIMLWPLVACLLLPSLLVYLGLHVIRREVIFVDLALAQVATLGTCVAILMHYDPHAWQSYAMSVGFTLVGAGLFTMTRTKDYQRVPQEALIGIIYVVSAAAGILLLSNSVQGAEELKETLVGDLLFLQRPEQVFKPAAIYLGIAVVHFIFRKKFLMISFDPERAEAEKVSVRWWDFLFYALFGLVVTTFVHIGGVLLVFTYLIVPAVCANYLAHKLSSMLLVGWAVSMVGSALGLYLSWKFSWPTGAAVVCTLGGFLLVIAIILKCFKNQNVQKA